MKYQDEIESGKRSRKSHMNISQQIEHYRKKLLQKVCTCTSRRLIFLRKWSLCVYKMNFCRYVHSANIELKIRILTFNQEWYFFVSAFWYDSMRLFYRKCWTLQVVRREKDIGLALILQTQSHSQQVQKGAQRKGLAGMVKKMIMKIAGDYTI